VTDLAAELSGLIDDLQGARPSPELDRRLAAVHALLPGGAQAPAAAYTSDTDAAALLVPPGWRLRFSGHAAEAMPPESPVGMASHAGARGPVGFRTAGGGMLAAAACTAALRAHLGLLLLARAKADGRMYLVQTGGGPIVATADGRLVPMPISSWLDHAGNLVDFTCRHAAPAVETAPGGRPPLGDAARKAASKFLSSRLRHKPGTLPMDRAGYVPVAELVPLMYDFGLLLDAGQLEELVAGDDRGRFEFSPGSCDEGGAIVPDAAAIRACSGHSIDVDLGLAEYIPHGPLFFGTVADRAAEIESDGLVHSFRRHTRLLDDAVAAMDVAVKRGCQGPVVFRIDAERMSADGFGFVRANNGEILGPKIPAAYIARLEPEAAPAMAGR